MTDCYTVARQVIFDGVVSDCAISISLHLLFPNPVHIQLLEDGGDKKAGMSESEETN